MGLGGAAVFASPSGSSPAKARARHQFRPDIGLTLVAAREGETIFKLGKAVGVKKRVAIRSSIAPQSGHRPFRGDQSQQVESQRLHRARQLEDADNHTVIVQSSVREWQCQHPVA